MNIVITGATCAIGKAISDIYDGETQVLISRSLGCDLTQSVPSFTLASIDVCVHVAECGICGLRNLWKRVDQSMQDGGAFILISSIESLRPHISDYALSKRRQETELLNTARIVTRYRMNVLRLGHIAGTRAWPSQDPNHLPPVGRFGFPNEVAQAVKFIASAGYMHGSIMTLDGGLSLNV